MSMALEIIACPYENECAFCSCLDAFGVDLSDNAVFGPTQEKK